MAKRNLRTGYIYHIYNRGIEKRDIFLDYSYYSHFTSIIKHYLNYDCPFSALKQRLEEAKDNQRKKAILTWLETTRIENPVNILSFCLMPNHYHLTLEQHLEDGISFFIHKLGLSYTKYFNIRNERKGSLFEGAFKSVLIESDEQLIHLSRYQHLNPYKLGLKTIKELIEYPWSSLAAYIGEPHQFSFLKPGRILNAFRDTEKYLKFLEAEIDQYEPLRLASISIDDDFGWFKKFKEQEDKVKKQLREQYTKILR